MSDLHISSNASQKNFFNPNLRILYCALERLKDWNNPSLKSPHWRVYFNVKGKSEISLKAEGFPSRKIELTNENIYIIPPNVDFESNNSTEISHFYLHFVAAPPFYQIGEPCFTLDYDGEIKSQIINIIKKLESNQSETISFSLDVNKFVLSILSYIPLGKLEKAVYDTRVVLAIEYFGAHLSKKVSNDFLGELVKMNSNAFARLFKDETGVSPQHYFQNLRIEKACLLLHFSELSIDEISIEIGFSDRFHFSKVFKKLRKYSPVKYRNVKKIVI